MPEFRLTVNRKPYVVDTEPDRPLLEVLREDLQLTGTKYGCGEGQCRACTVLLGGRAVVSCVTPVKAAAGKEVLTIEGLAEGSRLHRAQRAFLEEGGMQCGYCTSGMILRTVALLQSKPNPTDAEIIDGMDGSLCRCCGYPSIIAAVRKAAELGRGGKA